jgi:sortase A
MNLRFGCWNGLLLAVVSLVPAEAGEARAGTAAPAAIERIEITRLGIAGSVREGADTHTLATAVGHIPFTGVPGKPGNIGLAAHRDGLFRNLGNIALHDEIMLKTGAGKFLYRVESFKVVDPRDVAVLAASNQEILTLVTCFPFNFVGHAPQRFIVRAVRQHDPAVTISH